jgi:hypothetical protein
VAASLDLHSHRWTVVEGAASPMNPPRFGSVVSSIGNNFYRFKNIPITITRFYGRNLS